MQQEANGARTLLPEMKSELKSNEQESQTMTSKELSPEEMKSQNTARNRVIFLALIESAMRYREGYFREEIEEFKSYLDAMVENKLAEAKQSSGRSINERATRRKILRAHDEMFINFKNKKEQFNRLIYKEIESIVGEMGETFKANFDNYATGFGLICEELLKAKNTTELLTLCKLYNQGLMDNVFAEIRKKRENEKTTPTDSDQHNATTSNSTVQE